MCSLYSRVAGFEISIRIDNVVLPRLNVLLYEGGIV
jgi:hypothetical protein